METAGFSSRGLSLQANKFAGEVPGWRALNSDGDGIENWVRPRQSWRRRSIRPRYWLQLAAIAQILELNEEQAQQFFGMAGWSLNGLRVKASPDQRWLLDFGQPPLLESGSDSKSTSTKLVAAGGAIAPYREKEQLPARIFLPFQRPRSRRLTVTAATLTLVAIGLIAGLSLINRQEQTVEADEVAAPQVQKQPDPIRRSCLIRLNIQPHDTGYSRGVNPEGCPEMSIWNQYEGYEGGDLVSWDEGVAQCLARSPLDRLWVGFELANSTRGWLSLTPGTSSEIFRQDSPHIELRSAPNVTAPSIGIFNYENLNGKAFAVQLDLPASFRFLVPPDEKGYHLGGCWQHADRYDGRGLHFFWPPGVNP